MAADDPIDDLGRRGDGVRLADGVRLDALELNAEEGYLLSRVEGVATLGELLLVAGLPEPRTLDLLRALVDRGVVEVLEGRPDRAPRPRPRPPRPVTQDIPKESGRYGGFIFSPADLAEEVELDVESKKELLYRDAHREEWHHYEVLGLRPKATADDIRKSYFELTRRLHPDRYYGKKLGSYKERLARVVQRIREAYETLSDPNRRADYDENTDIPMTAEELAAEAQREADVRKREERREERRDRLRRRSPMAQRMKKVAELKAEAAKAGEQGDWAQAASLYRLAASFDPEDSSLAELIDEATALSGGQRAEELLQKATAADALGNPAEAERLLRQAVEVDPSSAETHLRLVRFLAGRGEPAESYLDIAQRATRLDRHSPEAWTQYGQALLASGDRASAKKAFQQAVDLDETADEAKEALKSLRWKLF